ncbi:hypothetical protein DP939_23630 [Spongiactinospora rosea]|uniref:DUF4190 domain-containing protein n=1 Tax=Spongiactinospora rosea TaxID=2248750 RepID=A0A366LV66_9ACTN|nr:hypothetical protein DP939_23630 [Spongiactinospora rosea]
MPQQPPPGEYGGPGQPEDYGQPPPYPQQTPYAYGQPYGAPPEPKRGGGLATTALVLGILSPFLLFACLFGVITAIVGLIIGIIALTRKTHLGRAWAGIILSVLTLIAAVALVAWSYASFSDCMGLPTQAETQRCIEAKLGIDGAVSPQ